MPDKQKKTDRVRILHAGVGPGYNLFRQGQIVPVSALSHTFTTPDGPRESAWDIERLLALGAVEYTDDEVTTTAGEAAAPRPIDADAERTIRERAAHINDTRQPRAHILEATDQAARETGGKK